MTLRLIVMLIFLFSNHSLIALTEVGDKPKNYCWTDVAGQQVCLEDKTHDFAVRVLLFNAGWCGPCNSEFATIGSDMAKFKEKNVVFFSLSCEGWNYGAAPNQTFLTEWSTKHRLAQAQAQFVVAGSPRHCGGDFFGAGTGIPNAVVVDTMGEVVFKKEGATVSQITKAIEACLPVPVGP